MEKTLDFYDNFNWDMVVDNTDVELPHLMQQILKNLAARSPQLRTILNHKDSPGKFYFRKRLGSNNVLLDSDDMEDGDTKKSQESAIRATSSAAGAQAGGVLVDADPPPHTHTHTPGRGKREGPGRWWRRV